MRDNLQNSSNGKEQQGRRVVRMRSNQNTHRSWQKGDLVQQPWKAAQQNRLKLNMCTPPITQQFYPKVCYIPNRIHTCPSQKISIITAAFFIIARIWKSSKIRQQ